MMVVAPTTRVTRHAGTPRTAVSALTAVRRFQDVCVTTIVLASVPYLWVLWDMWNGTVNSLRLHGSDDNPIYDVQARALMHGHLWIPKGSISSEAFVVNGHQYTYFGIFPSLLRIPIFALTNSFDGRLTAPSILASWITTALFCSLLLWRLRIILRGKMVLGWTEAISYGVLLASILAGSVLVFLAAGDDVYAEDLAWSVALACASFFAILGVVEHPTKGRVVMCGVFVLLTDLNRSTTGFAVIFATISISIWFATGRAGSDRRHWALPMALAGLLPMVVGCAIDLAKFGLLFGAPLTDQLLYKEFHLGQNGSQYFSLRNVPETLHAYIDPLTSRFRSTFPYILLSDPLNSAKLVETGSTSNALLSMPLLFACGIVGVVAPFRRGQPKSVRALRFLLIASTLHRWSDHGLRMDHRAIRGGLLTLTDLVRHDRLDRTLAMAAMAVRKCQGRSCRLRDVAGDDRPMGEPWVFAHARSNMDGDAGGELSQRTARPEQHHGPSA